MTDQQLARLAVILQAAAIAPGNRDRFQAAGLLARDGSLVADWPPAWQRLAPLDKARVRAQPGRFLASAAGVSYQSATSGSRGSSFQFFAGDEWNRVRLASRQRALAWWGIEAATPVLNVASRLPPVGPADRAIAGPVNADLIQRLQQELAARSAIVRGYPSRLSEVAAGLLAQDVAIAPPLAVLCTGELLYDQQRHLLSCAFRAPVIDEYGCQEAGLWGLTCPEASRLHLDAERCWIETGPEGELLATDLYNLHLPLARYRPGDRLRLDPDPCPCGRPGPTARLLGRSEDRLRTATGWRAPGEIAMPALPGIWHYRAVRVKAEQIQLQVWAAPTAGLEALGLWTQATFGKVAVVCQRVAPGVAGKVAGLEENSSVKQAASCEPRNWAQHLGQGNWAGEGPDWPPGLARTAADLLRALVQPTTIAQRGLPVAARSHFTQLLAAGPQPERATEAAIARILLLALSFLADEPEAASCYATCTARLQAADPQAFDPLIATLWLEPAAALAAWERWPTDSLRFDGFSLRHLLYALETAATRARTRRSPPLPARWTPLPALLLGDLANFTDRFHPAILAMWVQFVQGAAPQESLPGDRFLRAWLQWRDRLLAGQAELSDWATLSAAAHSPADASRADLERAYWLLARGEALEPEEWLPRFEQGTAVLPGGQRDPLPWAPVLRALAEPLRARGAGDRAYQCLVASAVPSSRRSALERQAREFNRKQPLLADGGAQQSPLL